MRADLPTFRGPRPAIDAPRFRRAPFLRPPWFDNIVGVSIDASTDWDRVQLLLVQSWRLLAPKRLAQRIEDRGALADAVRADKELSFLLAPGFAETTDRFRLD